MKKHTVISLVFMLILLIISSIILIIWGGTSSYRYGINVNEYKLIQQYFSSKDIYNVNRLLIKTKSMSTKLIILSQIRSLNDKSSIKYIIRLLDYDIPIWDYLDSETQDPSVVRFAAFTTLIEYGPDVLQYCDEKDCKLFGKVYLNALEYYFTGSDNSRDRYLEYKERIRSKRDYQLLSDFFSSS